MLGERGKLVNFGWVLLWGTFSTAWCWSAGHALGPTFDEQFYVQAGLKNWHDLNHRELLTQGTMPLPAEVQTFALRLAEVFWSAEPARDWVEWLPIARMGTITFWWLLLWASFQLAAQYGGAIGGRIAVALVACEPILLGHASLATNDLAFTACLVALLAVFRSRRDEATWPQRLLIPAIWFMLTFMTKASAMLFTPMCLAMVEAERLWSAGWRPGRSAEGWKPALESLRDLAALGAMGVGQLFVVCPRCLRGLLYQVRYQAVGWNGEAYLLGEYSERGFPYYFAAALAIKLALPILVLLVVLLLFRPRYLFNGAVLAALGLLMLTPAFRIQTGVRYVLPVAALALVGASAGYAQWWKEHPTGPRRAVASAFAAALVLWSLISSCVVWPNGMCYTNELFGGTRQGHLALTESNIDWGQGLNELAQWQAKQADAPLYLWYFGSDPRCMNKPFHAVSPSSGEELERTCRGGYLAVSMTHYDGYNRKSSAARHLRALVPCDQTSTYLIFDFRDRGEMDLGF